MKPELNLIYGKHAVEEFAKRHPNMIKNVWTSHVHDFNNEFPEAQFKIIKSTNDKMENLFKFKVNHQGYVAEVKEYNYVPFNEMLESLKGAKNELVLILDKIQDPYNLGAIIRSAALMNVKNIIMLDRKQVPITSTVTKTSAGTVYDVKVSKVANLSNAIKDLQNNGFWIYASNLNEKAQDMRDVKFEGKVGLIIGNEEKGVSEMLTKNSDFNIYIPSDKVIDSYNASVAAALLMYEISTKLKNI